MLGVSLALLATSTTCTQGKNVYLVWPQLTFFPCWDGAHGWIHSWKGSPSEGMILWRQDEGGLLIISGGRSLKSWDGSDHKGKVRIVLQEIQEKYIWKQKSFALITFQHLTNDNINLTCWTDKNQVLLTPMSFPEQDTLPALEILIHLREGGDEVGLYLSILKSACARFPIVLLGLHCD